MQAVLSWAVIFLTLAGSFHDTTGKKLTKEEINTKTCKEAVSYLMKTLLADVSVCTKSMKFKNGKEKAAKTTCIMKCVMITEKMITPEGRLDAPTLATFVNDQVPDKYAERVTKVLDKCLEGSNFDPTEEFCQSYAPPIKCVMEEIPRFCNAESN